MSYEDIAKYEFSRGNYETGFIDLFIFKIREKFK